MGITPFQGQIDRLPFGSTWIILYRENKKAAIIYFAAFCFPVGNGRKKERAANGARSFFV